MPTTKKGQKEIRVVLDDEGEVHSTLLEWAHKRRLTPGKAAGCILADWSDAINGKINPFAVALAATAGINIAAGPHHMTQPPAAIEEPENPEERARQAALLEAAEQFM